MISHLTIPEATTIHAIRAIETALAMVPGITQYEVGRGQATITHDGRATEERLREAVALAGFEVRDVRVEKRRLV